MFGLRRSLAYGLLVLTFIGWMAYPGWYNQWYSVWPENYAYPASMVGPHDPHWGFWFW
ncbi:MAG: hypothetical protein WBG50_09100 [Desulfomonilaceae bacterium]